MCALWTTCYGAADVCCAEGCAWAAEAGGVEGGAGIVGCGACVVVLALDEFEIASGEESVVRKCRVGVELGDCDFEGCEEVGGCEDGEGREEEEWTAHGG